MYQNYIIINKYAIFENSQDSISSMLLDISKIAGNPIFADISLNFEFFIFILLFNPFIKVVESLNKYYDVNI